MGELHINQSGTKYVSPQKLNPKKEISKELITGKKSPLSKSATTSKSKDLMVNKSVPSNSDDDSDSDDKKFNI